MTTERRTRVKEVVLSLLVSSGASALTSLAANALPAFKVFIKKPRDKYNRLHYIKSVVRNLADRGLVSLEKNSRGQVLVKLTKAGKAEVARYFHGELVLQKPKVWDRKYRLVIFDIKEWKRGIRDELRRWLLHLGFVRLQNSVWVYPYECQEIVVLLKSKFRIGKEILYLTVDYLENDYWLRREFNLS